MKAKAVHQLEQQSYKGYISVGATARYLGVSVDTVRRWEKTGKLHAQRLDGKNRYFPVAELRHFKSMQRLSTTEVARQLGVSESTVRRLEYQGLLIPVRSENNKRMYNQHDVTRYLASKRSASPTPTHANRSEDRENTIKAIDIATHGAVSTVPVEHTLSEQLRRESLERAKEVIKRADAAVAVASGIVVGDAQRVRVIAKTRHSRVRGSKGIGTYGLFAFISVACLLVMFGILGVFWAQSNSAEPKAVVANQAGSSGGGSITKGTKAAPLVLPETFFIKVKDTGLSINVTPGKGTQWSATVDNSDYAKLPIDSSQIADGGVLFDDLAPEVQDMLTAAAQVSDGPSITNHYTTQVVQGTNVIAGPGLSGTSDGNTLTLGLKLGSTTKIASNSLEVRLGGVVTSTTNSQSGLEATAQGMQLLGGCANGNVLRWSNITSAWSCASIGSGGGGIDVQEDATVVSPSAVAIQFLGSDFDVTDSAGTGVVNLAGTGAVAGTYGSATQSPVFHVDSKGRVTSASTVAISGITVGAGSGLSGGGAAAPAGSVSLNIGAGTGIIVNSDDISVKVQPSKGLEADANGLSLVDCANNQVLKYNAGLWACAADNNTDSVASVFGRTGVVIAQLGDYTASQITNSSTVSGSYVSDALNTLKNASLAFTAGGNLTGGVTGTVGSGLTSTLDVKSNPTFSGLVTGQSGLAITAGGASVTGGLTADSLSGEGSGLTNINAATLSGQVASYYLDLANATGSLSNSLLAGSGTLTVNAGNGLTGGGLIALGGSSSLSIGAGDGILVNANDVAISVQANKGLQVGPAGLALVDCSDGQLLKYGSGQWACGTDSTGSGGGGAVDSVFGRTGVVIAQLGDYTASQITNSSTVSGSYVSDALNTLKNASLSFAGDGGNLTGNVSGSLGAGLSSTLAIKSNPSFAGLITGASGLSITSGGANITGTVLATAFTGDGSNLSNINAASLNGNSGSYYLDLANATGVLDIAQLSSDVINIDTTGDVNGNLSADSSVALGGTLNLAFSDTPTFADLTLSSALSIANGGTGAGSFASGGVLFGNGTGALQVTSAGSNGQLLVASAGVPVFVTAGGDATLAADGTFTLSTVGGLTTGTYGSATNVPQITVDSKGRITNVSNVAINTAPTGLAGGDLSGSYPNPTVNRVRGVDLDVTTATSANILIADGTNWVSRALSGDVTVTSTGVATIGMQAITNSKLANSGIDVNYGTNLSGDGAVALGGTLNINFSSNPTFSGGLTVSGGSTSLTGGLNNNSGGITNAGAVSGVTTLNTSGTINGLSLSSTGVTSAGGFSIASSSAGAITLSSAGNIILSANGSLLNCGVSSGKLTTNASGVLQCATDQLGGGGGVVISGTSGRLAIFNSPDGDNVVDSDLQQVGGLVQVDTLDLNIASGDLQLGGTTVLTSSAALQNITGITSAGPIAFTDLGSGVVRSTGGTLSAGSVALGSEVSGTLGAANGGTGINGSGATNGQLLIGNGAGYTLATLTQGAGVTVTNGAGSIAIAATLGNSVDSGEITDGTITEDDLSVSNVGTAGLVLTSDGAGAFTWAPQTVDTNTTYSAGNGLAMTGTTFNIGTGNCITANADDIAVTDACVNAATLGGNSAGFYQNATNITAGTLNVARLDSSVTLLGSTITKDELTNSGILGFSWADSEITDSLTIDATGSVADGALSGNVTLLGNSFNGASQLVKLDAGGKLTALDGSALTNLSANNLSGVVGVTNGGTGISSFTTGDLLYASGPTTLTGLSGVAAGSCLISGGIGAAPQWGSCSVDGGITGSGTTNVLPIFNGSGTLTSSKLSQNVAGTSLNVASGTNLNILGGDVSFTGALSVSGQITLSGLSSTGVVHTNASGVLSTGDVALGSETSGNYVSSLGTLTGLSTTGNSGEGTTPSLAVLYGSGANTAVQGNTGLTVTAGTGLTGGASITLGSGGTATLNLANTAVTPGSYGSASSVATFTVDQQGRLTAAGTMAIGNLANAALQNSSLTVSAGTGLTGGGSVSLGGSTNLAVDFGSLAGQVVEGDTALTITAGTGLTGGGTITLGSGGTSTLNVAYGSAAGTAVQGNTMLTCPTGTGNLSGGGTSITLGSGGTCSALDTKAAVSFGTSVTTPTLTSTGALSISSTGVNDLSLTAGSGKVALGASTIQTSDNLAFDLTKATNTTLSLTNSGAGVAGLSVEGGASFGSSLAVTSGGISITGNSTISGSLSGLTGLTVASGGANITGGLSAAGTISFGGLNSAGVVHTNSSGVLSTGDVVLGTETSGNYLASLGSLTGLTLGGTNGVEGGIPTLSVNYGSGANQAAAGSNTFTCNSGTGNLSGGGGTVTLGTSGTSCGAISITNAPTFTTSVTTPTLTSSGALTVSSTGANNLTLTSGSGTVTLNASTIQRSSGLTFDLNSASATTFAITNSGAGVAGLTVEGGGSFGANLAVTAGGISITGNSTIAGSLSGITGLTIASGGANITGGLTSAGVTTLSALGSGIVRSNSSGQLSSSSVALGTDTTGNYVGTVSVGNGLSVSGVGAPNATANIGLDVATTGTTATTSSNSGLETDASGLKLLGGCTNGQILKWNGSAWACSADSTGLSDSRLKTAVTNVGSVLDDIKGVRVVTYNFDCLNGLLSNLRLDCDNHIGIISQELASIFPGVVSQNSQGYYEVNFRELSFYTLRAVVELANKIDSAGNATLNSVKTGGTLRLSSAGALQNITGLTMTGGASISGGINNNSGGITNAGSITGVGSNITGTAGLTIASGGSSDLTLNSGSGTIKFGGSTLQRIAAGTTTIDLNDTLATSLKLTNNGIAGTADLNLDDGGLKTNGTTRLTNGGALQNITGLTVTSGGATIAGNSTISGSLSGLTGLTVASGGATISGGLNNGSGGITNVGSLSGITSLASAGDVTFDLYNLLSGTTLTITNSSLTAAAGLSVEGSISAATSGTINGLNINGGSLSGVTGISFSSGNLNTGGGTITSGAVNGQTISSAANFTGTVNSVSGYRINGTNGTTASCSGANYPQNLNVSGGIVTSFGCAGVGLSDERLKTNIASLDGSALDKIKGVHTVNFAFDCSNEYFSDSNTICDTKQQTGVLAQELASIFPDLVSTDDYGYYHVDYQGLGIYNLKAVSQLAQFIDSSGNADFNSLSANDLSLSGTLVLGDGLSVDGLAEFNGNSIFDGTVSFGEAVTFNGPVTFNGQTHFSSNTGGYASISAGQDAVHVDFNTPYAAPPIVSATLGKGNFAQYSTNNVTATGFDIVLSQPATSKLDFSWLALSITNPSTTSH